MVFFTKHGHSTASFFKLLLLMKPPFFILIGLLFVLIAISALSKTGRKGHSQEHMTGHHRFEDADKWAAIFEDPERDAWQKPEEVIRSIGIQSGTTIADIGSATGYFPVRFARVARTGQVYGVDIEQTLVDYLNTRAVREQLPNLVSILGDEDDPRIPEKVDLVFICDTYHHIQDRSTYFENLKKYMQPQARLVVVDFKKGDLPVGPSDEMKLAETEVIKELTETGYRLLPNSVELPYQYILVFNIEY